MTDAKVACPRCGQDWLNRVELLSLGKLAVLCPECDALWIDGDISKPFVDYGTFMRSQGQPEPEAPGEVEVLGPLLK